MSNTLSPEQTFSKNVFVQIEGYSRVTKNYYEKIIIIGRKGTKYYLSGIDCIFNEYADYSIGQVGLLGTEIKKNELPYENFADVATKILEKINEIQKLCGNITIKIKSPTNGYKIKFSIVLDAISIFGIKKKPDAPNTKLDSITTAISKLFSENIQKVGMFIKNKAKPL